NTVAKFSDLGLFVNSLVSTGDCNNGTDTTNASSTNHTKTWLRGGYAPRQLSNSIDWQGESQPNQGRQVCIPPAKLRPNGSSFFGTDSGSILYNDGDNVTDYIVIRPGENTFQNNPDLPPVTEFFGLGDPSQFGCQASEDTNPGCRAQWATSSKTTGCVFSSWQL